MKKPEIPNEIFHVYEAEYFSEEITPFDIKRFKAGVLTKIYKSHPNLKDVCLDDTLTISIKTKEEYPDETTYYLLLECSANIPNPNYIEELKLYIKNLEEYIKTND